MTKLHTAIRTGAVYVALVILQAASLAGCGGSEEKTSPVTLPDNSNASPSDSGDEGAPLPSVVPEAVGPDAVDANQGSSETNAAASASGKRELIILRADWFTWDNADSGIRYDPAIDRLLFPATPIATESSVGVQRYLHALTAGQTFELSVNASGGGGSASLFLYGSGNTPLLFRHSGSASPSLSGQAVNGAPLRFVAPDGVLGYAVQVTGAPLPDNGNSMALSFSELGVDIGGASVGVLANDDLRPAGYENLLFADEFDGTSLDRSTWCTRLTYGGGPPLQIPDAQCTRYAHTGVADYSNSTENQRFRDFNTLGESLHQVGNGSIRLRATNTGADYEQRFEAAAIRSKVAFRPTATKSYYITARVKLPDVLGIWPAFYIIPGLAPTGKPQWPPEVDIFEGAINGGDAENPFAIIQHAQVQGAQTDSRTSEWYYTSPGFATSWGFWKSLHYLRERWLEVGLEWTYGGVCYFVDGIKTACENYRWVTNDGSAANPAELIMQLSVGGPWAGRAGIDDAAFPTQLEVDHIRVYEK